MKNITIEVQEHMFKGTYHIEVIGSSKLAGLGIKKNNYCGNLNCYFVTKKAMNKLKDNYKVIEL